MFKFADWIRHHIALSVIIGIVVLMAIVGIVFLVRLGINKYKSEPMEKKDDVVPNSGSNASIDNSNIFYFSSYIYDITQVVRRDEYYQSVMLNVCRNSFDCLCKNLNKKWVTLCRGIDEVVINSVKDCVKKYLEKDTFSMTINDFQEFSIELINLDSGYGKYLRFHYDKENYYWNMDEIEKSRALSANPI